MRSSRQNQRQRGAALLLLMLVVIIASTSVLLVNLNRDELRNRRLTDTRSSLAEAKTALIEYAVLNPDLNAGQPIGLPCPDLDGSGGFVEGEAHTTSCGATGETMIGRLPWRTLGIPALKDSGSECLWYVVSGSFKMADAATAAMINADSNGLLQLIGLDSGDIVEGLLPQDRPVAMVVAAMRPVGSQTRPAVPAGRQCNGGFDAADFLDVEPVTGVSNATTSGIADGLDQFAVFAGANETHNDRIITITRADIADRVSRRADFAANMRALGLAAAGCVADYAANNPSGATDKRLPWPATVALTDYRNDANYDDADSGNFSGRLPDAVDDSNTATGNPISRVLSDCDPLLVPEWSATTLSRWQNWKDHFFYAVAESHVPSAVVPSACSNCLTVNGAGQYVAIIVFSNTRLDALGQVRNAPPTDTDTKNDIPNYLEGNNAINIPGSGTSNDYSSQPASSTFNDLLFCIDQALLVTEC